MPHVFCVCVCVCENIIYIYIYCGLIDLTVRNLNVFIMYVCAHMKKKVLQSAGAEKVPTCLCYIDLRIFGYNFTERERERERERENGRLSSRRPCIHSCIHTD